MLGWFGRDNRPAFEEALAHAEQARKGCGAGKTGAAPALKNS